MSSNSSLFSHQFKTHNYERHTDREAQPILNHNGNYSPMKSMIEEGYDPGKIELTDRIYQMLEKTEHDNQNKQDESNTDFLSLPRLDIRADNSLLKATYDDDNKRDESLDEEIELKRFSTVERSDTTALMKAVAKKIQIHDSDKKMEQLFRHAVNVRKRFRIIFYFLACVIILAGVFISAYFLCLRGRFFVEKGSNIYIGVQSCELNFYNSGDYEDSAGKQLEIEYKIPASLFFVYRIHPKRYTENKMEHFEFLNLYPKATCRVNFFIPKDFNFNQLTVECFETCSVMQNSTLLKVNKLFNLTGGDLHVNFRNLEVGHVVFDAYTGHFQANHILSTSSLQSKISIQDDGDIIIQSTENLHVTAETPSHSFCFGAPFTEAQSDMQDCYILGDDSTEGNINMTTCSASYNLCKTSGCSPTQDFYLNTKLGNIYSNIIEYVEKPFEGSNVAAGYVYGGDIGLDEYTISNISLFNNDVRDSQNSRTPLLVLNLGNFISKSSYFAKFVATSNPAYSYMKPWWLSTFSLTILGGTKSDIMTNLFPGFCPFYPQLTSERHLIIQNYLQSIIAGDHTIVTFVRDRFDPFPPDEPKDSSGIFQFVQSRNPIEDRWYTISQLDNGYFSFHDNNLSESVPLILAIIISFIIAAYISIYSLKILVFLLNYCYYGIVDKIAHQHRYIKLSTKHGKLAQKNKPINHEKAQREKEKEEENQLKIRKYGFGALLWNSPSPSAYIDALILLGYRQLMNSVPEFYRILMRPIKIEDDDFENPDPSKEMILGSEAKLLYEKFCFLNYMTEQKLTDQKNLKVLKSYGFEVYSNSQQLSEVFIKLLVRNNEISITNTRIDNTIDSLDIFVKENIVLTAFEEDTFEVDDFFRLYNDFCELNRFPKVSISASLVKERYQISSAKKVTQIIRRIPEKLNKNSKKKKVKYVIDKNKLNDHFSLIKQAYKDLPENRLRVAIDEYIMFTGWKKWDLVVIVAHIIFDCGMSLPLLFLAVFNETEYSPFSLKDPSLLISKTDIYHDPSIVMEKLFTGFGWNIVITILVIIYWGTAFFDIIMYYLGMDFPQDKIFKKTEDNVSNLARAARIIQWGIVLTSLSCYLGYLSLVGVWWLLGAILNPNAFLPYATGVATFVTFVTYKYVTFKKLAINGKKSIMSHLEQAYTEVVSRVMKKLSTDLEGASEYLQNKGKAILQSEAFQAITEKLKKAGIVDDPVLEDIKTKIENHTLYVQGENLVFVNPAEFIELIESTIDQLVKNIVVL